MSKKYSDKETALMNMMVAGNGGESRVEIPRPNPDEGVYSVTPDEWDVNETVGVINATFKVNEKLGDKADASKGRFMRVAFWVNNPASVQRTARSLHLALTGTFLNDQPELATVMDWFLQLTSAPEWIVRRTVKAGKGRYFENDAFFSPERWRQLEKDSNSVTNPAEIATAVGSS